MKNSAAQKRKQDHPELDSSINVANSYELPCTLIDDSDRHRGIPNLFIERVS